MSRSDFVRFKDCATSKKVDTGIKNKWNWKWSEEVVKITEKSTQKVISQEIVSSWCEKLLKPGCAWCRLCNQEIKYTSAGFRTLSDHAKSQRHLKARKIVQQNYELPCKPFTCSFWFVEVEATHVCCIWFLDNIPFWLSHLLSHIHSWTHLLNINYSLFWPNEWNLKQIDLNLANKFKWESQNGISQILFLCFFVFFSWLRLFNVMSGCMKTKTKLHKRS